MRITTTGLNPTWYYYISVTFRLHERSNSLVGMGQVCVEFYSQALTSEGLYLQSLLPCRDIHLGPMSGCQTSVAARTQLSTLSAWFPPSLWTTQDVYLFKWCFFFFKQKLFATNFSPNSHPPMVIESDCISDDWLLTAFKPHSSLHHHLLSHLLSPHI